MRAITKLVALAALAAGLTMAGVSAAPQDKVSIRGSVTKLTPANDAAKDRGVLVTVLIEGPKDKATEYDRAWVTITTKTKLEKLANGKKVEAKAEDLKAGAKVESVFTGPVAESYPVQATAGSLVILEDPKK